MALGRREHVGEGKGARRNSPCSLWKEEAGKEAAGREPMRDLKEAGVQICHLSASEPLVGNHEKARRRGSSKPDFLLVTRGCREGRWAEKQETTLPGEGPPILGRCNYDTLSPKRRGNAFVMGRRSADEAIVIIKPDAGEVMVTSLRVKHKASLKDEEVKGGTCKRSMRLVKDCASEISH